MRHDTDQNDRGAGDAAAADETADPVTAMTDTLAAQLYWHLQDRWERTNPQSDLRRTAERLVDDAREPTPDEIDLLASARHTEINEARRATAWIGRRYIVDRYSHHGADLISDIKFMRVGDIAITAVATVLGVLVLQGLGQLGTAVLGWLTSFM